MPDFQPSTSELNHYVRTETVKAINIYLESLQDYEKEMKGLEDIWTKELHRVSLIHIIECAALVEVMLDYTGVDKNVICTIEQIFNYNFCLEKFPAVLTMAVRRLKYETQKLPEEIILSLIKSSE